MHTSAALMAAMAGFAMARQCTNLTIPISIEAQNGVFDISLPSFDYQITDFILDQSQQGNNYTAEILTGYQTISGNYSIAATLCNPDSGPSSILQVLTHGIGFDRSYWDFSYNNYNFSYVNSAIAAGYSTFSWDRLGVGNSSHGNPISEIQAPLEVAALKTLTTMLRQGRINSTAQVPGHAYTKTVHVGHSFGSAQTYTLSLLYPNITDGIVLTGFSQNASFAAYFLQGSNFIQANSIPALSSFPTGYFAPALQTGVQIDFFSPGDFSPEVLAVAYNTQQPVTPGELLTLAGQTGETQSFTGPVLVITGERDTPYCGGDCYNTGNPALASIPAKTNASFPNASNFEAYIVPGAGHGLNLQYTHTITYQTILKFLSVNGLAA